MGNILFGVKLGKTEPKVCKEGGGGSVITILSDED